MIALNVFNDDKEDAQNWASSLFADFGKEIVLFYFGLKRGAPNHVVSFNKKVVDGLLAMAT